MTRRQQWLNAIRGPGFPTKMRVLRATLLCLPVLPDGRVVATDDVIAEVVGLPRRTLQWHLAKAVEAGWLQRVQRGGNGHRCRFVVAVPVRQNLRTAELGSAQCTEHSGTAGVRNLVAVSYRQSEPVGERKALTRHREQRTDHDGPRDQPDRDEKRADETKPADTPNAVDLRRLNHRTPVCTGLRRAA